MTATLATISRPKAASRPPARSAGATPSGARACDALRELRADHAAPPAPRALVDLLLAVLTLGAWPAVRWAARFRAAAAREQATLDRLVWWAAGRVATSAAARSLAAAGRLRARPWLPAVGQAAAAVAVAAALWAAATVPAVAGPVGSLVGSTLGFQLTALDGSADPAGRVVAFLVWSAGLTVAYLAHLLAVQLHAADVRRFLDEFNRTVAVEEGFGPVLLDPIGWGFSPPWVLAAILLLPLGGAWAVPFAVAGATDRRYRLKASRRMRAALADRVRDVCHAVPAYDAQEPVVATADPVARCETPGCNTRLAAAARFCPRCGARQRPQGGVDVRA